MTFKKKRLGDVFNVDWGDTSITKASYKRGGNYLAYSASGPDGMLDTFDHDTKAIIVSAIGANCGVTFFAEGKWTAIKNTICITQKDPNFSIEYLYQVSKNSNVFPKRGSAQPFVSKNDVENIELEFPDKDSQLEIARPLFLIEKKISHNLNVCDKLDKLGMDLFDYLTSVGVKESVKRGLSHSSHNFTESVSDVCVMSQLGEIPENWSVKSLTSIGSFLNGIAAQNFPASNYKKSLPVLKIAQLRDKSTVGSDRCSDCVDSKYIVKDGDIVFSWSASLEIDIWNGGKAVLNQHLFKVEGFNAPDWFMYFIIKRYLPWFRMIAGGKATTMGHIQRSHLDEVRIVLPNAEYLDELNFLFQPLLDLRNALSQEVFKLLSIKEKILVAQIRKYL